MLSTVECVNDDEWNNFLEKEKEHQMVTIAHNPCLGKILSNTFGYSYTNYVIKDGEHTVGVMPIVNVGKKMVSMPHFSYGGPVVQPAYANTIDISTLLNAPGFELRSFDKLSEHYIDKKISCILKLEETEDEMFMTVKSKLRQKIRKTLKMNLGVKSGGVELLHDFYTIFSRRMLLFGSPPLGKQFFRNLLDEYTHGDVQITVIYDGNKAISAGFSLSYLGFNELCWSGTDDAYARQNVNALMFWEMIKTSIAKKHQYFSFGRSTIDSTQHNYKKLWNPIELPIFYNLSDPPKTSLRDFEFLTKIWKHQPLRTSQILGHYVSKYVY